MCVQSSFWRKHWRQVVGPCALWLGRALCLEPRIAHNIKRWTPHDTYISRRVLFAWRRLLVRDATVSASMSDGAAATTVATTTAAITKEQVADKLRALQNTQPSIQGECSR